MKWYCDCCNMAVSPSALEGCEMRKNVHSSTVIITLRGYEQHQITLLMPNNKEEDKDGSTSH